MCDILKKFNGSVAFNMQFKFDSDKWTDAWMALSFASPWSSFPDFGYKGVGMKGRFLSFRLSKEVQALFFQEHNFWKMPEPSFFKGF